MQFSFVLFSEILRYAINFRKLNEFSSAPADTSVWVDMQPASGRKFDLTGEQCLDFFAFICTYLRNLKASVYSF